MIHVRYHQKKKLNMVWYHRKQKLNMVLDKLYKMKELKTKMRKSSKLVLFLTEFVTSAHYWTVMGLCTL